MKVTLVFSFIIFLNLNIQDVVKADPEECYNCNTDCKTREREECFSKPGRKIACLSMKTLKDDKPVWTKSCAVETEDLKNACKSTNQLEGGRCFLCDTNLCNSGKKYLESIAVIFSLLIISTVL